MKNNLKLITSKFALLSILFAYPSVQAKLDPKMMKEVTKYFKVDKTHFSPVIGMTALESGLVHNFRFYGSLDMGSKPNNPDERLYTSDKAHQFGGQKDAMFDLLHMLFRSPAGTLGQHVAGAGFANFHTIATPEKVAHLLNFVQEATQILEEVLNNPLTGKKGQDKKTLFNKKEGEIQKKFREVARKYEGLILKNVSDEQNKRGTKDLERDVKDLLKSIVSTVLQEQQIDSEKQFLYPAHTTEQIILAYFCHKFDTQKDVIELLHHLDTKILDSDKKVELETRWQYLQQTSETDDDLLSAEDLDKIIKKPNYTIDDIYALIHQQIFDVQVLLLSSVMGIVMLMIVKMINSLTSSMPIVQKLQPVIS